MRCLCAFLSPLCSSFCFGGRGRKRELHFLTKKMRKRMKTWPFMEGVGLCEDEPVSASSPSRSEPRAGPTAVVVLSPHGRISQMLSSSAYPAGAAPLGGTWAPAGRCCFVLCQEEEDGEVAALALTAAERKQRPVGLKSRPRARGGLSDEAGVSLGGSQGAACLLGTVLACQTSLVGGGRPERWGLTQVTLQVTHSKLQGPGRQIPSPPSLPCPPWDPRALGRDRS